MKNTFKIMAGILAIGLVASTGNAASTYTDGTGEIIWAHAPADIISAEV